MDTDKFFQSKLFKGIILGIAGLIILVFVFGLGVFVGTKRADFSFQWAEEYHRNFAGPSGGFVGDIMGREFTDANGVFGQILTINGQTLTIKGQDNVEKTVLVGTNTTIHYQRQNKKLSDLTINENIVVIGEPNSSGQIQAELIRILPSMPPKPQAPSNTTTN